MNAGVHANYKLQADWRLFGAHCFEFAVIERTSPERRLIREQFYIDRYRAAIVGYNIQPFTDPTSIGKKRIGTTARAALRALKRKQRLGR